MTTSEIRAVVRVAVVRRLCGLADLDGAVRGSLAIRSWRVLAERTAFNEIVAGFKVTHDDGPVFTLMVALAPGGNILRAWQIVPGEGGSTISPDTLPYHIRDIALTAVELLPRRGR